MPSPHPDWQRPRAPDTPPIAALSQAIDLAQAPRLAAHMRRRPLPRDVLTLIRLAARCPETMAATAASLPHDREFVVAAAELYLRQVVCFPGADPYRILGVPAYAPRTQMRQHMRELVLWLHPDRNPTGKDAVLMQRVLEAWRTVDGAAGEGPSTARVALAAGLHDGRIRRPSTTYRPAWISQPLPKRRPRRRSGRARSAMALGLAVVLLAMVVPEYAVLGPRSPEDGPQRRTVPPPPSLSAQSAGPSPRLRTDLK